MDRQRDRQNNFDLLRIAMAIAVVYSHCFPLLGMNGREPGMRFTGAVTLGTLAVQGFFAISGFLIAESWLRTPDVAAFLRKRVLRIYPAFIAAVLFCGLIVGPLGHAGGPSLLSVAGWRRAVIAIAQLSSFSLPDSFSTNPFPHAINGSLWTIKYEFLCYLALAAMGSAQALRKRFIGPLLGIVAVCHIANRGFGWQPWDPPLGALGKADAWFEFATYFLAGVMVRLLRRGSRMSAMLAVLCAIGLSAATAQRTLWIALCPLLGVYLLFYAAFISIAWLDRFRLKGDYSYGIYLYAFPLQQLIIEVFGRSLTPWVLFMIAAPLAAVAGALSWHLIEWRFLRLKLRSTKSRFIYIPAPAVGPTAGFSTFPQRRAA